MQENRQTVRACWKSVREWIAKNASDLQPNFDDGATAAEVREFEAYLGRKLPADFADSLRPHTQASGVIPAPNRDRPDMAYSLLDVFSICQRWKMMNSLYDSGEFDDRHELTKVSKGVVRQWWAPYWIPFADNGGGDYLCIDLCPTFPGVQGQVIWVAHDNAIRPRLADSLGEFMRLLSFGYDSGHYDRKHAGICDFGMVRIKTTSFPRSKLS